MPDRIYDAIEFGIEPSMEVIQAFTNVIGALCLNQAGQEQLSARPAIIPSVFMIFTSERHLKVLQEKENAMLIGTYFDELVRHHPSLKDPVFTSIMSSLDKILALGKDYTPPESDKAWYGLTRTTTLLNIEDVPMEEAETAASSEEKDSHQNNDESSGQADDLSPKPLENPIIDFIDVMSHASTFANCSNIFISNPLPHIVSELVIPPS